jgi:hypothetical protein
MNTNPNGVRIIRRPNGQIIIVRADDKKEKPK